MNCLRLFRCVERPTSSLFKTLQVRCISGHHVKFVETQDRWRDRDGIEKDYELIYKTPMNTGLKLITTFITFSTTTVGLSTLYYSLFKFQISDWEKPMIIGEDVVIANTPMEAAIYFGTFLALHIAVKILLSKFVVRLYQNGNDYIAVFRGHWYNDIKKHKFHARDFKKLQPTMVVTWGDSRYSLGNKHAILLDTYFKTPEYLNDLLANKESKEGM